MAISATVSSASTSHVSASQDADVDALAAELLVCTIAKVDYFLTYFLVLECFDGRRRRFPTDRSFQKANQ